MTKRIFKYNPQTKKVEEQKPGWYLKETYLTAQPLFWDDEKNAEWQRRFDQWQREYMLSLAITPGLMGTK